MLSDEQARELCTWHRGVLRAARPLDAGSTSRHPPGQKHAARDVKQTILPPSSLAHHRECNVVVDSVHNVACHRADDARGRTEGHRARTRRGREFHLPPVPSCDPLLLRSSLARHRDRHVVRHACTTYNRLCDAQMYCRARADEGPQGGTNSPRPRLRRLAPRLSTKNSLGPLSSCQAEPRQQKYFTCHVIS